MSGTTGTERRTDSSHMLKTKKGGDGERYRFQKFSDRVASVNVDVTRKVRRVDARSDESKILARVVDYTAVPEPTAADIATGTTDDKTSLAIAKAVAANAAVDAALSAAGSSNFVLCLKKHRELDLTESFVAFDKAVHSYALSLPLVLHHKPRILDLLLEHVSRPTCTSTTALLDLLSNLARDLQSEFTAHDLGRIFTVLLSPDTPNSLLDTRSPELLEAVFSNVVWLQKFLVKQLVPHALTLFTRYYVPLLAHVKPYVRQFAASAFAFLLRKITKPAALKSMIHAIMSLSAPAAAAAAADSKSAVSTDDSSVRDSAEFRDGISIVLVEWIKNVQNGWHSNVDSALPLVFATLNDDDVAIARHRHGIALGWFTKMCTHARDVVTKTEAVWTQLIAFVRETVVRLGAAANEPVAQQRRTVWMLSRSLSILNVWIRYRKGALVFDKNELLSILQTLFSRSSFDVLIKLAAADTAAAAAASATDSSAVAAGDSASYAALHSALTLLATAATVQNNELHLSVLALLSHQSQLSAAAAAAAQHSVLGAVFRVHAYPSLILSFVARLRVVPAYVRLLPVHVIGFAETILSRATASAAATADAMTALSICLELTDRASTPTLSVSVSGAPETASLSRTALPPTVVLRVLPSSALLAHVRASLTAFATAAASAPLPRSPTDTGLTHVWACLQLLPLLTVKSAAAAGAATDSKSDFDYLSLLDRVDTRISASLAAVSFGAASTVAATATPAPSVADTYRWLSARCAMTCIALLSSSAATGEVKRLESIYQRTMQTIATEAATAAPASAVAPPPAIPYTHPAWLTVLSRLFDHLLPASAAANGDAPALPQTSAVKSFAASLVTPTAQRTFFHALAHNLSSPSPDRRRLTIAIFAHFPPQPYLVKSTAPNAAGTTTATSMTIAGSNGGDAKRNAAVVYHSTAQAPSADSNASSNSGGAAAAAKKGSRKSTLTGTSPLLSHCHSVLFSAVSLDEEKEITRHVRQLELMIASRQLPDDYVALLPHFLLGTLRIRFSLLWKDIQSAFAALAVHYPAVCWPVYIHYLRVTATEASIVTLHARRVAEEGGSDSGDAAMSDDSKEETTAAQAAEEAEDVDMSASIVTAPTHAASRFPPPPPPATLRDRFAAWTAIEWRGVDALTLFNMLWSMLAAKTPAGTDWCGLLSSNSRSMTNDLVVCWLQFLRDEWSRVHSQDGEWLYDRERTELQRQRSTAGSAAGKKASKPAPAAAGPAMTAAEATYYDHIATRYDSKSNITDVASSTIEGWKKTLVTKLNSQLSVLSKVLAPKALPAAIEEIVKEILFRLLSKSDPTVQELTLDCLCKWNFAYLIPYKDRLKRLISEQTFREEMAVFHLHPSAAIIVERDHRTPLAAVLVRVLIPKLLKRKTTQSKSTLASRRAAIFSFLAGLTATELSPLLAVLLQPFTAVIAALTTAAATPSSISSSFQLGEGQHLHNFQPPAAFWSLLSHPTGLTPALWASHPVFMALDRIPAPKQVGVLKVLQHLLSQMRGVVTPFLSLCSTLVLVLLVGAQLRLDARRLLRGDESAAAAPSSGATSVKRKSKADAKHSAAVEPVAMDDGAAAAAEPEAPIAEDDMDEDDADDMEDIKPVRPASASAQGRKKKSKDLSTLDPAIRKKTMTNEMRTVRQLCYQRMAQLLDLFSAQFAPPVMVLPVSTTNTVAPPTGDSLYSYLSVFLLISSQSIRKLPLENTQHRGGLLDCMVVLARHRELTPVLVTSANNHLLASVFGCLSARGVHASVVDAALSICEQLLLWEADDREQQQHERRASFDASKRAAMEVDDQPAAKANLDVKGMPSRTEQLRASELRPPASEYVRSLQLMWGRQVPVLLTHMHTRLLRLNTRDDDRVAAAAPAAAAAATSTAGSNDGKLSKRGGASFATSASASTPHTYPKRELDILAKLAVYATSVETSGQLVELLLPAFKITKLPENTRLNILSILRDLAALLSVEAVDKMLPLLSRQFLVLRNPIARRTLSQIFDVIANKQLPALKDISKVLSDLNALSTRRLDEPDHDRRTDGFREVSNLVTRKALLYSTKQSVAEQRKAERALSPLLYCLLFAIYDEELSVRGHSVGALCRMISEQTKISRDEQTAAMKAAAAAAMASTAAPNGKPAAKAAEADDADDKDGDGDGDGTELVRASAEELPYCGAPPPPLIAQLVYPALRKGLKSQTSIVRTEHVNVLSHLARSYPVQYAYLSPLIDTAHPELDFFLNFTHIQAHRRRKALQRLSTACAVPGRISSTAVLHVLLPLVSHVIYESQKVVEHTLLEEAIRALGSLASCLAWSGYFSALQSFLKQIPLKPTLERTLVRVVVTLVEAFHFDLSVLAEEEKIEAAERDRLQAQKVADIRAARAKDKAALNANGAIALDSKPVDETGHALPDAAAAGATADAAVASPATEEKKADAMSDEAPEEASAAAPEDEDENDDADADEKAPVPVVQSSAAQAEAVRVQARKIRDAIAHRLLPEMYRYLTDANAKKSKESASAAKRAAQLASKDEIKQSLAAAHNIKIGEGLVRVPVAMAIVRLLLKLTANVFHLEFPRLVAVLAGHLTRRDQTGRDTTRGVLVDIAVAVGPKYIQFIFSELHRTLTRGYQVHVLGHTVYSILAGLQTSKTVEVGAIDYCRELLFTIVMEDFLGETAKQKEVDALRNQFREVRISKAFDIFELMARLFYFSSVPDLVRTLQDASQRTQSLKTMNLISEALRRVGLGLNNNPSVTVPDLLIFIHKLISDSTAAAATPELAADPWALSNKNQSDKKQKERETVSGVAATTAPMTDAERREAAMRRKPTKDESAAIPKPKSRTSRVPVQLHRHTLTAFGLQLLLSAFRKNKLNTNQPQTLTMLDPFVPLLRNCCLALDRTALSQKASQATSTEVLSLTLKCSCFLMRIPSLPSLATYIGDVASYLFSLLPTASSTADLLATCYKTLAVIIRYVPSYTIKESHVRLLLGVVAHDMLDLSKQSTAFSVLHAIVVRKVLLPEVYDMMQKVIEILVQHPEISVQQQCAIVFLRFLLDYPLSNKRLQQHLGFLLNNISYPTHHGRLAILALLHTVVVKFPVAVLDANTEFLVLPLVMALVNDDNETCRVRVAGVLKAIVAKLSPPKIGVVMNCITKWLGGAALPLQRVAAQLLGLVIEVSAGGVAGSSTDATSSVSFQKFLSPTLSALSTILSRHTLRDKPTEPKLPAPEEDTAAVVDEKEEDAGDDEKTDAEAAAENGDGESAMKDDQPAEAEAKADGEGEAEAEADTDAVDGETKSAAKKSTAKSAVEPEFELDDTTIVTRPTGDEKEGETNASAESAAGANANTAAASVESSVADLDENDDIRGVTADRKAAAVAAGNDWRVVYYCLIAVEKAIRRYPKLVDAEFRRNNRQLWRQVCDANLHIHSWVRIVSARIWGVYFETLTPAIFATEQSIGSTLFGSSDAFFDFLQHSCVQLASPVLDRALAGVVVNNLMFLSLACLRVAKFGAVATDVSLSANDDDATGQAVAKKKKKKSKLVLGAAAAAAEEDEDEKAPAAAAVPVAKNRALNWLVHRLSYMARGTADSDRHSHVVRQESIFQLFAVWIKRLPPALLATHWLSLLHPLYRVSVLYIPNVAPFAKEKRQLKVFAGEVLSALQSAAVDPAAYFSAYNQVRAAVETVRDNRRTARKQQAVTRPDVHAARKIRQHTAQRSREKRKLAAVKLGLDPSTAATVAAVAHAEKQRRAAAAASTPAPAATAAAAANGAVHTGREPAMKKLKTGPRS